MYIYILQNWIVGKSDPTISFRLIGKVQVFSAKFSHAALI